MMRDVRIAVYAWIVLAFARRIARKIAKKTPVWRISDEVIAKFWNDASAQDWVDERKNGVTAWVDRELLAEIRRKKDEEESLKSEREARYASIVSSIQSAAAEIRRESSGGRPNFAILRPSCGRKTVEAIRQTVGPDARAELVQGDEW
jgi:hypothetical protein